MAGLVWHAAPLLAVTIVAGSALTSPALAASCTPRGSSGAAAGLLAGVHSAGRGAEDGLLAPGAAAYHSGDFEAAAAEWLRVAARAEQSGETALQARALEQAAAARDALGYTREAHDLLERASAAAAQPDDPALRASIESRLALSRARLGDLPGAGERIEQAHADADRAGDAPLQATVSLREAELRRIAGDHAGAARQALRAAGLADAAQDATLAAVAHATAARSLLQARESEQAARQLARARAALQAIGEGDARARLLIHVARSYGLLAAQQPSRAAETLPVRAQLLGDAVLSARAAGSARSESWALGELGAIHQAAGESDDALVLTRRALVAAQRAGAPEARYRWHWQLGRILRARGDPDGAIREYRRAARVLDGLRSTTGGAGLELGEHVQPVYVELVDLLLLQADGAADGDARRTLLLEARERLEDLKSAELVDYFQDACLSPPRKQAASAVPGTVVVHPVILADRTVLLVSRGAAIDAVRVDVPGAELTSRVRAFRRALPDLSSRAYRQLGAELYDLLIRPIAPLLGDAPVDALVFAPGGALRTIPMSALYDRETRQYLVQQHPIAVIPALHLIEARAIDRGNVRTLRAGLRVGVQGFPALESVGGELEAVGAVFEGESLLDEAFVEPAVADALGGVPYGIVHIATHGQFGASASDSFLLTYDGRIDLERLGELVERTRFRKQPIELLTLSACETGAGDDQSALGLAGVAVRAGARSALATLWTVNDAAASRLIAEFYRQLSQPGVSRAEALRRAQISLIEVRSYRHPRYWAPYLLISDWL